MNLNCQVQITQTRRESNKSADFLANLSLTQIFFDACVLDNHPRELHNFLVVDIFAACIPRNVWFDS
jgi:hypothetical protein